MGIKARKPIWSVDEFHLVQGQVEPEEAIVSGNRAGKRGRCAKEKAIVIGMKKHGCQLRANVTLNVKKLMLRGMVPRNVEQGEVILTDEPIAYRLLTDYRCNHGCVTRSEKIWWACYMSSKELYSTEHVESFGSLFKASVRSTHIHVSAK